MKPKIVSYDLDALQAIRNGVESVFKVAKAAYGPLSGNVLLQRNWGAPTISHDGVTNVREVFLKDAVSDMAAQTIKQAAEKSNQTVGDGTSAVSILAAEIYFEAIKRTAHGNNPLQVSKQITTEATLVAEAVMKQSKPLTDDLMHHVATISAGDEAIGAMIADTLKKVGTDGGVLVEKYPGYGIYNDIVEGFYFQRGFTYVNLINNYAQLKAEYHNIAIMVTDKRLSTVAEIAPILDKIAGNKITELVIIGEVIDDAAAVLAVNKTQGKITTTVVGVPTIAGSQTLFLEDIAVMIGAQVLQQGANSQDFKLEMLGQADKIVSTEHSTTIIGGRGDEEEVRNRIAELKLQLKDQTHHISIDAIKQRLSKLTGKVAVIKVGGALETEVEETKLRVDDAVAALQSAMKDGIVPGGGVTLLRLSELTGVDILKKPLTRLFYHLLSSADENAEGRAAEVLNSKDKWSGFNLKNLEDGLVNLLDAGVVDPAKVIEQVVVNAASVSAGLVSTSVAIATEPEEK